MDYNGNGIGNGNGYGNAHINGNGIGDANDHSVGEDHKGIHLLIGTTTVTTTTTQVQCPPSPLGGHFARSKSVGSVSILSSNVPMHNHHVISPKPPSRNGATHLLKWFKKTFSSKPKK